MILVLLVIMSPVYIILRLMRKKADIIALPLRKLLNQEKWSMHFQKNGRYGSGSDVYVKGFYKGRLVECTYARTALASRVIGIDSKPNVIPKKTPWFKFVSAYPTVYTNNKQSYIFNNERVYTVVKVSEYNGVLSEEVCKQLLDDLVHACEMVERGEYTI